MINNIEHFFMYLLACWTSSCEISVKVFAHFLKIKILLGYSFHTAPLNFPLTFKIAFCYWFVSFKIHSE